VSKQADTHTVRNEWRKEIFQKGRRKSDWYNDRCKKLNQLLLQGPQGNVADLGKNKFQTTTLNQLLEIYENEPPGSVRRTRQAVTK